MCIHCFEYPPDKQENYNPDGKTLMGRCKCGAQKKAYGMRWILEKYTDNYGDSYESVLDKRIDKRVEKR